MAWAGYCDGDVRIDGDNQFRHTGEYLTAQPLSDDVTEEALNHVTHKSEIKSTGWELNAHSRTPVDHEKRRA